VSSCLALSILLAVAACSPSDAEVDGGRGAPVWDAELLHEIGSVDAPGETLTRVGGVVLTGDDLLLIGQPSDRQIRVHGPGGAFLRTIGRGGEGPGELGRLGDFAVSGDTVTVVDGGNSRITEFGLDGSFRGDEHFERVNVRGAGWLLVYSPSAAGLADGSSVSLPVVVVAAALGRGGPAVEPEMVVRRMTADGALADTVLAVDRAQYVETRQGQRSLVPIGPIVIRDRRGDGAILALRAPSGNPAPGTFRLIRVDAAGDTVFDRAFSFVPRPIPADTLTRVLSDVPEERRATVRDMTWAPEFRPPVTEVVQGTDGTIWLMREALADTVEWWAIDPATGDHAGTLGLPRGARLVESRAEDVVVVRTDDLDVQYVQRWRVRRRTRSGRLPQNQGQGADLPEGEDAEGGAPRPGPAEEAAGAPDRRGGAWPTHANFTETHVLGIDPLVVLLHEQR
jgi:hypothetical protein